MKRRILFCLVSLLVVLSAALPAFAAPDGYPDLEGGSFWCRAPLKLYNMDGTYTTLYRYSNISIISQTDGVIDDGLLTSYITNSVRGSRLVNTTAVATWTTLVAGNNTITVTTFGNQTLTLPAGVEGTATSGTATVTGSPLALETGNNTITTTGNGQYTLNLALDGTIVGALHGVVGTGWYPRIQLAGTTLAVTIANGTGTVTEAGTVYAPGLLIHVTGAGNFTITLPEGMVGTLTSGTATITGSPVALVPGANVCTSGATTGTATLLLEPKTAFIIAGKVRYVRDGSAVSYMTGRIDGFVVLDTEEWEILSFGGAIRGSFAID